jgi:hypothetical protein
MMEAWRLGGSCTLLVFRKTFETRRNLLGLKKTFETGRNGVSGGRIINNDNSADPLFPKPPERCLKG